MIDIYTARSVRFHERERCKENVHDDDDDGIDFFTDFLIKFRSINIVKMVNFMSIIGMIYFYYCLNCFCVKIEIV